MQARERARKWAQLPYNKAKSRERWRRYNNSERGKARNRRNSRTEKRRAYMRSYKAGDKYVRRGAKLADHEVTLDAVYDLFEGVCQLCGHDVCDLSDTAAPMAARATIDHIVPISAGGNHEWTNVRLAHHGCNAKRGVGNHDGKEAVDIPF